MVFSRSRRFDDVGRSIYPEPATGTIISGTCWFFRTGFSTASTPGSSSRFHHPVIHASSQPHAMQHPFGTGLPRLFEPAMSRPKLPRKVKVTYILGSLSDAGTERQALALMTGLDRERFSVSLILFQANGAGKIPKDVELCPFLDIPQESSKWLSGVLPWAKAMRKVHSQFVAQRPDIVHAFLAGPSILGVIPARLARVPVFIGSRRSTVAIYRRGRRLAALADTLALRLAHLNLGNSSAVSGEMISLGGCPPHKVKTIYNGVDTLRFHPGGSQAWRAGLGWDDSHVVFGMVANFYTYKRHIDFVKAAALILKRHPQARFVMVGADYGQKETIAADVTRLGLTSTIRILDSDPFPEKIFSGIDVLVSTSETEGFSNVLLEAMACGKPVIATDVGGNPELVQEGVTGFLVPPASPPAIAQAAERLLIDREKRLAMGICGRRRVEQHFSLERMVRSHEQMYLRLLAGREINAV
jgi:L-malate glycosyltransferase